MTRIYQVFFLVGYFERGIDSQNKSACVPVREAVRMSYDLFTGSIIIRRLFLCPAH